MENEKVSNKLNLTPNEIVGYKIKPDQWNWTAVVVKKHGAESKHAGQEYESPLAYCKNLTDCVSFIFNHVSKIEGRKLQDNEFKDSGNAADLNSLNKAFDIAKNEALKAVSDLEQKILNSGYDIKTIRSELKTEAGLETE